MASVRRHFVAFAQTPKGTPQIEKCIPGVPPPTEAQITGSQQVQAPQREIISLSYGTPGTPEVFRRCSGEQHPQTPALQGFDKAGTPGTLGTPQNDVFQYGNQSSEFFEERAAILEYDEGLIRADAERIARTQIDPAPDTPLPTCLSWKDYDVLMDAEIAQEADPVRRAKLERQKSKGSVVEIDGRKVYTRGRYH